MHIRSIFAQAVVVVTLVAAPVFALAQTSPAADGAVSLKISLDDINFNTAAGAKAALSRIQTASRIVCGHDANERSMERQALMRACENAAVRGAVAHIGQPRLSALAAPTSEIQFAAR